MSEAALELREQDVAVQDAPVQAVPAQAATVRDAGSSPAREAEPFVILYIFSGPHLGAEVELPAGSFVIGTDDSCDIILHGTSLAARHAALALVRNPAGLPEVTLTPLDGPVRKEDVEASSDAAITLAQGEVWYLGLTCLAWNRPGVVQRVPDPHAGPGLPPPAEGDVSAGTPSDTNDVGGDGGDNGQETATMEADSPALLPDITTETPPRKSSRSRFVLWLVLLICLGALSIVWTPTADDPSKYTEIIEQKMKEADLSTLKAQPFAQGVEVRGSVADEQQLTELRNLARTLHFPVYLDKVTVRSDWLQAVYGAFRVRGFYPAVSVESTPSGVGTEAGEDTVTLGESPTEEVLMVAAYIKDRLLEEGLFAALRDDAASLPPLRRHIVHEGEVDAALRPALEKAGLDFVYLSYLPGTILVEGNFTGDSLARVHQVLDETGNALGVPLHAEISLNSSAPLLTAAADSRPEPIPAPMPGPEPESEPALVSTPVPALVQESEQKSVAPVTPASKVQRPASIELGNTASALTVPRLSVSAAASAPQEDVLGGLKVTGVTMKPLRFVTTSDGQRLFEGAVLPGGYVLERISTRELTLRKGGQTTTYVLRGSS